MKYLDPAEQELLCDLMTKHRLCRRYLGTWNAKPYNIELIKDAKPYHAKAFPVPRIHQQTMRSEVERLCEVGVLR
jgi:hypothetical protein